jgi:hypothetical protein
MFSTHMETRRLQFFGARTTSIASTTWRTNYIFLIITDIYMPDIVQLLPEFPGLVHDIKCLKPYMLSAKTPSKSNSNAPSYPYDVLLDFIARFPLPTFSLPNVPMLANTG